jgi:hypothetical protein
MLSKRRTMIKLLPRLVLATVTFVAAAPPAVTAETVSEVVERLAEHARFDAPTRADVRIECTEPCPKAGSQAIVLARGDAVYVELRSGLRALVRPDRIVVAEAGKVGAAPPGKTLGDTNVLLEDLVVFTAASLSVPQISDDGPAGVVVTAAPAKGSAYALMVHTIDRERAVILRTLYYRDSVSNLVKTRRNTGFVQVASRWRPAEMTFESIRGATTKLTLAWREAADAPAALFEEGGLAQPSGLAWPP